MAYQYPNTPGTLLQATPVQFSGFTSLNFVITAKAATLQPNHILPISRNAQPRRPRHPDLLRRLSPARIRSRSAATDDRRRGKLVSALFHTIARNGIGPLSRASAATCVVRPRRSSRLRGESRWISGHQQLERSSRLRLICFAQAFAYWGFPEPTGPVRCVGTLGVASMARRDEAISTFVRR